MTGADPSPQRPYILAGKAGNRKHSLTPVWLPLPSSITMGAGTYFIRTEWMGKIYRKRGISNCGLFTVIISSCRVAALIHIQEAGAMAQWKGHLG